MISRRLKELLGTKRSFDSETNRLLFAEYVEDKAKNIPPEESEVRTLLILGNEDIVHFVLRKQFAIYGEHNDLEEFSEGKIGLINAIDGYDNNKDTEFITYAYQAITHQIYKYYNMLNSSANLVDKQKVSLNECISNEYEDKKEIHLEDALIAEDDFLERLEDKDFVKFLTKYIIYLTTNEQICVINSFGLFGNPCLPQSDIAEKLGKAQSSVSNYIKVAMNKLRVLTLEESSLNVKDLKLKQRLLKRGPQNEFTKSFEFVI